MATRSLPSRDELFAILDEVKDPEVPVLTIAELGILRDVAVEGDEVIVTVTPTYSGCPAMGAIEQEIVRTLHRHGVDHARVRTTFQPAWTTDWMTAEARRKLEAYGIAPPGRASTSDDELVPLRRRAEVVKCPFCGSANTVLESQFGSTACKSIRVCRSCQQPFEQFKAI